MVAVFPLNLLHQRGGNIVALQASEWVKMSHELTATWHKIRGKRSFI
jgi:hypothetical protein